jgi:hypothetical protein
MTDREYNQLLKFVYHEGYANSYEEAEYLLEEVSDSDFETIYDEFSSVQTSRAVCDYLVSEGFAPDVDSASSILSVMSEEWLNQIMETEVRPLTGRKLERFNAEIEKMKDPEARKRKHESDLKHIRAAVKNATTPAPNNTPTTHDGKRRGVTTSLSNVSIT